jgi:hypothetical protein
VAKPTTLTGYSEAVTRNCERVLVTLLRNLGPWKKSVFLIGGLVPRYLVPAKPPEVPRHAGTLDLDVVIDLVILEYTDAYRSLEENLKKIGFERAENEKGQKQSWRWKIGMEDGTSIILELLADKPELRGGKVEPLPTDGQISALNIPYSSIVFDLHETVDIQAELLDEEGVATETIRFANIVSFTCLKALAFDDRAERKDAHDLVYCIENAPGGMNSVVGAFRGQREGKHAEVIQSAFVILRNRFATDDGAEGYRKDGPVAVARFEIGEDLDRRESRVLRQRSVAEVIEELLRSIG